MKYLQRSYHVTGVAPGSPDTTFLSFTSISAPGRASHVQIPRLPPAGGIRISGGRAWEFAYLIRFPR